MGAVVLDLEQDESVRRLCSWLVAAFLASFVALMGGVKAPYGRYSAKLPLMPSLPGRVDWWGHSASFVMVFWVYWSGRARAECLSSSINLFLVGLFVLHYVNRGPVFACVVRECKPIPLPVLAMTSMFCAVNGWMQATSLLSIYWYEPSTAVELRFLLGLALFVFGMSTNIRSDLTLINLRKPDGGPRYRIPYGGMFEYVSGANFFGECVEWLGFALMCGTPASWTFACTTFCNIGPRAVQHHSWYKEHFGAAYPASRKALIPFLL